jgi:hypothetical protein
LPPRLPKLVQFVAGNCLGQRAAYVDHDHLAGPVAAEVRYIPLLAGPDLVKPVPPCSKCGSIRQYGPWCECPPSTDAQSSAN